MASGYQPSTQGIRSSYAVLLPSISNVVFVATLSVLVFRIGGGLLFDGDTGYHIRAGQEILKSWRVPVNDIFSFHSPAMNWTAHEWLAELVLSAIHSISGLTGVVIFFSVLIAATHWLLYSTLTKYSTNNLWVMLITVLVIVTSSTHWLARPHIFSLVLTTVWYDRLNRFQYENRNTLQLLPLLMVFWVNLHAGYFFGLVLICVYIGGNIWWSFFTPPKDSISHREKAKRLFTCLIISIVTCGINPIGFEILLFPLKLTSDTFIMDSVIEFMSPNFHEPLPFKYMLLATVAAVSLSRNRSNPIECGLLLLLIYMALYSARYISLFAIIVAPLLLKSGERLLDALPEFVKNFIDHRNRNLTFVDKNVHGYFWPAFVVSIVMGLGLSGHLQFTFDEKRFPVAAVNFMMHEQITGKMFNNDEFGDYIIFAAWPRYRVFIDGRSDMYGRKWAGMYLNIVSLQPGWDEVLSQNEISWVIFDTKAPLTYALNSKPDWLPIYSDEVATIFLKKSPEHARLLTKYQTVRLPVATNSSR